MSDSRSVGGLVAAADMTIVYNSMYAFIFHTYESNCILRCTQYFESAPMIYPPHRLHHLKPNFMTIDDWIAYLLCMCIVITHSTISVSELELFMPTHM